MRKFSVLLLSFVLLALPVAGCGDPGATETEADAAPLPPTADAAPDASTLPESCRNGVKDDDETDVDCGGTCGDSCAVGKLCSWHYDCAQEGICAELPRNRGETAIHVCHSRVDACVQCGGDQCLSMQTNIHSDDPTIVVTYCRAPAKLGAACDPSGEREQRVCEPGSACGESPVHFVDDVCLPVLAEGATCHDEICADGLGCVSSKCTRLQPVGGSCLNTFECAFGAFCDESSRHCTARAPSGSACRTDEGCGKNLECKFADDLVCASAAACGSQMDCCAVGASSECRPFDGHTHCTPPAGTCQTPVIPTL